MHRIIPVCFALFCSNIVLSGEFKTEFQPNVSKNEELAQKMAQFSGSERVAKSIFAGILKSMNAWLEAKKIIGEAYIMDDEDNALLEKVTNLAQ